MVYRALADVVVFIHAAYALFVVFGLMAILVGTACRWDWVRNFWFRLGHLCAIAVVVLQSWFGVICPLTIWEQQLRQKSGQATYTGSFVAHWLHELLFFDAPNWVFAICYTGFASLVLLSWYLVPPRIHRQLEE